MKTPSNFGGYPRHVNDQNRKETKPWHIRLQRLRESLKFYHREKMSKNNKEREFVAYDTVLCLGYTQLYSSLALYTFNECFPGTLFRK
jgi:hypothetical protein